MLCGPGDTEPFRVVGSDLVEEWNSIHSEAFGYTLRAVHWRTDATPDLRDRGQGIINSQLLDKADIIIGVFWNRFGTPTGVADSGTEEEVLRATKIGKRVLLYFCEAEDVRNYDVNQAERVQSFKTRMLQEGLCWTFRNREEF